MHCVALYSKVPGLHDSYSPLERVLFTRGLHLAGSVSPSLAVDCPATGQMEHDVLPAKVAYDPLGQMEHCAVPCKDA